MLIQYFPGLFQYEPGIFLAYFIKVSTEIRLIFKCYRLTIQDLCNELDETIKGVPQNEKIFNLTFNDHLYGWVY